MPSSEGKRVSAFQELLRDAGLEEEFAYLREPPRGKARLFHGVFELFGTALFNLWCPLTVHGRERLPSPPFMVCSNHSSHMDSAALMYASGMDFNQFGMVAARDYFFENKKRKNSLPLLMNLIPADRKSSRQTIARIMAACREFLRPGGRAIIIYPEGTRSTDGEIASLKKGPAMIATELDIPIVPAYVHGTFDSLPKFGKVPKPRRITVHFGEAIHPGRIAESEEAGRLIYTDVTNTLTERILKLHGTHHGH
ncbi:MAG: 1-acyl-sn-glycerol-3-phosphate acyltransferase [Verrucomicrobiales bacterium]|nr:1-acyl-sn-glycerol-3-phosphate acyltransferase [Verrucomicrobiales bacterium]MBL69877.1 1-acyl-sn-glycerol-3-phosphate acyltransferase [Verrucomicrobiales bacterium]|tara:strand:- start:16641 stop:17399 length:759 start_codon:yes stop_codon:yes gene_type:complete